MHHNLEGCIQESKQYISPNSDYAYTRDTGCLIFARSVRLRVLASAARVKNAVRMRVFPASGAYLPLKLYAITKQTKFRPQNSKK